jgi:transcriptional regulator with XRE-family HTH domain
MVHGFPTLLRQWRTARRLSQEQLASDAELSPRHLSCLETGKARPSRGTVLVLASALELELRERNVLLGSAGFAAVYSSHGLDSLSLAPVRRAIDLMLAQQEPFGAVLIDRCWNILRANGGATRVFGAFPTDMSHPAIGGNLLRATFHPAGLRPWLVNYAEVATLALDRQRREVALHPTDAARRALLDDLLATPDTAALPALAAPSGPIAILHLRRGDLDLRLFTTITTLGTPLDVTAEELRLETFFPADDPTERWLRATS